MTEVHVDIRKVLAAALVVASIAIVADRLLAPPPVQIIIEGGAATVARGETIFTPQDAGVLVAFSWLGGIATLYLLLPRRAAPAGVDPKKVEVALSLLDDDEKSLLQELVNGGGSLNQSDLVVKTQFSESKVSRLLDRLEGRGLVARVRQGMGNVVTLKKF